MIKTMVGFFCLAFIIYVSGCVKSAESGYNTCTGAKPTDDSTALLSFANSNGITPDLDSTGLYYQIIDSGSGVNPSLSSKIYVTYTGKLMTGLIVDSTTNAANTGFLLSDLIKGWQIGLPKIKIGGHIKLLIPSAYAYGCAGSSTGIIPRDAPLYYDVTLVDVK